MSDETKAPQKSRAALKLTKVRKSTQEFLDIAMVCRKKMADKSLVIKSVLRIATVSAYMVTVRSRSNDIVLMVAKVTDRMYRVGHTQRVKLGSERSDLVEAI